MGLALAYSLEHIDQAGTITEKQLEKKPAKWLFPTNAERQYERRLLAAVDLMIELTEQNLFPALPRIVEEANALRPDDDTIHIDQYAEQVSTIIGDIEVQYLDTYTPQVNAGIATEAAENINTYNKQQFQKVMKSVLGVDVFVAEPWLQAEASAFVRENVALIKSVSSDYFKQLEETIFRGVRQGMRHEEIAAQLNRSTKYKSCLFDKTKNRAKLIARDQTNKFNGKLTELRQTSAGIKQYRWNTVGDKRVRPKHRQFSGKIYSWPTKSKPNPKPGTRPGEDIQCRCWAEPIFNVEVAQNFGLEVK